MNKNHQEKNSFIVTVQVDMILMKSKIYMQGVKIWLRLLKVAEKMCATKMYKAFRAPELCL